MNIFTPKKRMSETMKIDTIIVGDFFTNCYLVSVGKNAILIDPGEEPDRILETIESNNVAVEKIIITHGHIDHIGAIPEIREATKAKVLIHRRDADMLTDAKANLSLYHSVAFTVAAADGFLDENDIIEVGDDELKVIYTPGHSPGGISLLGEGVVFTGDALFFGSIGRTDLPGGNHGQLLKSIKEKLLILPDDTRVFPGHGPETTIGNEKFANPWLT
jgi:hydroxyacylglutathione hydrolase